MTIPIRIKQFLQRTFQDQETKRHILDISSRLERLESTNDIVLERLGKNITSLVGAIEKLSNPDALSKGGLAIGTADRKSPAPYAGISSAVQKVLANQYRELADSGKRLSFKDVEFKNHSQTGEDGILLYIFSIIGTTNRIAFEMCAGNGIESNTANLIINHDWIGALFDGDEGNIATAKKFYGEHPCTRTLPPAIFRDWITAENVNELIEASGLSGEVDLLSLDLDGVDYWVWKAIDAIQPRVVVLEFNGVWMTDRSVTVPYDPEFIATWHPVNNFANSLAQYAGASLPAFVSLGREKGYRLVGVNSMCYNAFFVREDIDPEVLPEVEASECFTHPVCNFANKEAQEVFAELDWVDV